MRCRDVHRIVRFLLGLSVVLVSASALRRTQTALRPPAYPLFSQKPSTDAQSLQEKQQQVLIERGMMEEVLMSNMHQSLIEASSTNDPSQALRQDGVVRIDKVLSTGTSKRLRDHILEQLHRASDVSTTRPSENNKRAFPQLAKVLLNQNRWDLLLDIEEPIVRMALYEILQYVGPTLEEMLGVNAPLHELASLISEKGCHRQNVHPDHAHQGKPEPLCLTCFVALQDITENMGPTIWIPTTHRIEAHQQFQRKRIEDPFENLSPKDQLLSTTPSVVGLLPIGSCVIFDSRALHCGTAHHHHDRQMDGARPTTRALFYVSFQNENTSSLGRETGSLSDELRSKRFTLATLMKELRHQA